MDPVQRDEHTHLTIIIDRIFTAHRITTTHSSFLLKRIELLATTGNNSTFSLRYLAWAGKEESQIIRSDC